MKYYFNNKAEHEEFIILDDGKNINLSTILYL